MSKVSTSDIIYALRCCASPDGSCEKKDECPYFLLDPIDERYAGMEDEIINGQRYCYSCDYDQISRDAADRMEGLG